IVPTVERGLRLVDFWSIETAGDNPSMKSTSGLSICPRNWRGGADSDSTYRRWPSAKIVSKARLDLPEPDRPVKTMRASRGRSRLTSRRLCSRAPRTIKRSATWSQQGQGEEPKSVVPGYPWARTVSVDHGTPHRLRVVTETYSGNVKVGGASDSRDTGPLRITKVAVGPMDNNAYFLRCTSTGDVLLVDAANEPDRLLRELGDDRLGRIVTTHQHFDHWQALPEVFAATGAPVAAHPLDAGALPVEVVEPLEDGDTVRVGDCELSVIHIVGHTPGSIALLYQGPDRPHLFTGDCLFPGGVGNTEKDPQRFASLINDVEQKLFDKLPDSTWVYPGHGGDTTLGAERPNVAEWRTRGW